jgi:hypothetical protein
MLPCQPLTMEEKRRLQPAAHLAQRPVKRHQHSLGRTHAKLECGVLIRAIRYRHYGSELALIHKFIVVSHSIQQGRKGVGEPRRCTHSRPAAAGAPPKTLCGARNVSRRWRNSAVSFASMSLVRPRCSPCASKSRRVSHCHIDIASAFISGQLLRI